MENEQSLDGLELYQLLAMMEANTIPADIDTQLQGTGWWFILIGSILLVAVIIGFRYWKKNKIKHRYAALSELNRLQTDFHPLEVSQILKRCALVDFPRHQIAALTQRQWAEFLDKTCDAKTRFPDFYQLENDFKRADLLALSRFWVMHYKVIEL